MLCNENSVTQVFVFWLETRSEFLLISFVSLLNSAWGSNIGIFVHHNVNNSADPVSRTYVDWMRDEFLIGFRTAASSYFRRAAEWEIVHTVIWLYSCWFAKLSDWPASQCLPAVEKDTLLMINMRTHGAPAQIQSLCHIEVISDKNADVSL